MPTYLPALFSLLLLLPACGDDNDDGGGAGSSADASAGEDLDMQASDFACIKDGTNVHLFYLRNPLDHLDEAVAVANSESGGAYPVGTILQLIPQEAMVKRARGWSSTTNDWEFFFLSIAGTETTIVQRGTQDVENSFGGNCFGCHSKAEPQWDLVCEKTHGCDPLPIDDGVITGLQDADTRCD